MHNNYENNKRNSNSCINTKDCEFQCSKTIKNWISILESSGIIYLLQPFSSNLSNRIIKSPKLYFMNTGLCSYLAKYPNQ